MFVLLWLWCNLDPCRIQMLLLNIEIKDTKVCSNRLVKTNPQNANLDLVLDCFHYSCSLIEHDVILTWISSHQQYISEAVGTSLFGRVKRKQRTFRHCLPRLHVSLGWFKWISLHWTVLVLIYGRGILISQLLLPANEVCKGYVFTPVCQSFCSQGGGACPIACWDTPARQVHPLAGTSPWQVPPPWYVHPLAGTPSQAGTPPWQVHSLAGSPLAGTPPGRYTPSRYTPTPRGTPPWHVHPPAQCMLGYGQKVGGTHPTGMQSCCEIELAKEITDLCKSHST